MCRVLIEWTDADVLKYWNSFHWEVEGEVDLSKDRSFLRWTLVLEQTGKTNPCSWRWKTLCTPWLYGDCGGALRWSEGYRSIAFFYIIWNILTISIMSVIFARFNMVSQSITVCGYSKDFFCVWEIVHNIVEMVSVTIFMWRSHSETNRPLKMKAVWSFEMAVTIFQVTCHIP